MSAAKLKIIVVNHGEYPGPDEALDQRSRLLRSALLDAGYDIIATLPADVFLADRVRALQPDLLIVDAESDARDAVEHVVMATRDAPRPIVLFTDHYEAGAAREAMAQGITAYIVDGLESERVQPVLDVAIARFAYEQKIRDELEDARSQLADRKIVEKAKGLLMARQGLSEDEAFRRLRRLAMDRGLKLAELARRIVDAADLLG